MAPTPQVSSVPWTKLCIMEYNNEGPYWKALGFFISEFIKIGYIDDARTESSEKNENKIEVILSGLLDSKIVKVMKCTSTKQIWDKIQNIYEERSGDCYTCELET
jgi:hypothetical protein